MKSIFVRAVKKLDLNHQKLNDLLKVVPKDIHMTYSIQYHNLAKHVKDYLEIKGIKVHNFVQVLGCRRIITAEKNPLPIIHIGSGKFHATNPNLFKISKEIILFDGYSIAKVDKKLIKDYEKKRNAKISRFFSADKIGLLVSNKYGQQDLKRAIKFIKSHPDKNIQLFLCNNINIKEFENFNIDFWVNSACPRIEDDSSEIISLSRVEEFEKSK